MQTFSICQILIQPFSILIFQPEDLVGYVHVYAVILFQPPYGFLQISDPDLMVPISETLQYCDFNLLKDYIKNEARRNQRGAVERSPLCWQSAS